VFELWNGTKEAEESVEEDVVCASIIRRISQLVPLEAEASKKAREGRKLPAK
jgi:hypothetical protein